MAPHFSSGSHANPGAPANSGTPLQFWLPASIASDDANYRVRESFGSDINDCNTYVRRLLAAMNMELPKPLSNILADSDRWQGVQRKLNVYIKYVGYLSDGNPKPQVIKLQSEEGCEGGSKMKREACSLTLNNEGEKGPGTFYDELALYRARCS